MTKSEVRAVSVSKLELGEHPVLYDIGAGTGSVSIEAALAAPGGTVWAIEQKAQAAELIRLNKERFKTGNLTVVEGRAPEILESLPVPTHAFIGGSTGNMEAIICHLRKKNPRIRVVIDVIALETLTQTLEALKKLDIEAEILSVQIAKAGKVGAFHLMQGQNPVYVISFGGAV